MATKHRFFDELADVKERTDSMAAAFNDPTKYPDLTVTCGERTWHCHKIVLGGRSDWFEKAMSGKFKEGGASTIAVLEEDLEAFETMLAYCYSSKVGDAQWRSSAVFDVKMFALGEKYFVKGLTKLSGDRFATSMREKHRSGEDLYAAILEAYTSTSDGDRMLCNTISDVMIESEGDLMHGKHETAFDKIVSNCPEFAADMARALAKSLKRKREPVDGEGGGSGQGWYKCPYKCGGTTFSAAMLVVGDADIMREVEIECSKCGVRYGDNFQWWKQYYGT